MTKLGAARARLAGLAGLVTLVAGCAGTPVPVAGVAPPRAAAVKPPGATGLVVGQTVRELEAAFGPARAMFNEGTARRLQFASAACVLDAYLYPGRGGEPAVTHVDTRAPTGEDYDRAACVAALRLNRSASAG